LGGGGTKNAALLIMRPLQKLHVPFFYIGKLIIDMFGEIISVHIEKMPLQLR